MNILSFDINVTIHKYGYQHSISRDLENVPVTYDLGKEIVLIWRKTISYFKKSHQFGEFEFFK